MTDEPRRLHVPIDIRWGDLDAYNHVNNSSMLKLLEEARVRAFWQPSPGEDAPATAVFDPNTAVAGVLMLIARQEIEYVAPVPYQRAPLDVQMWLGRLGGSNIDICYEVFSTPPAGDPVLYARAATTVVTVSADTNRPVRLTPQQRAAWEPYVGPPIEFRRR